MAKSQAGDPTVSVTTSAGEPKLRRSGLRLVVVGIASEGAVLLCDAMARTAIGQRFDHQAYGAALGSGFMTRYPAAYIAHGIDIWTLGTAVVAVFAAGLVRHSVFAGIVGALVAGSPVVASHFLRYDLLGDIGLADHSSLGNTFPSDHVAAVLSVALACVLVSPPTYRRRVAVVGTIVSSVVALEVQALGWHFVSDAVGAVLLVFSVATVVVGLVIVVAPARPVGQGVCGRLWPPALLRDAFAALFAAIACAAGIGAWGGSKSPVVSDGALAIGVVITVSSVTVAVGLFLMVTGGADFARPVSVGELAVGRRRRLLG